MADRDIMRGMISSTNGGGDSILTSFMRGDTDALIQVRVNTISSPYNPTITPT
jgi:hypothetical protein